MTVDEFSDEFDTLVDSYRRFKDFDNKEELDSLEFNEYEKSLFLTKAQEEIVVEFYSGKNQFGESFEKTEEIRRYLSSLIGTYEANEPIQDINGVSSNSYFFCLPDNLMFIVYESADIEDESYKCKSKKNIPIIPITHDEYNRLKDNPFRGANDIRILRLDSYGGLVELISKYNIKRYVIRYVAKLSPIILIDLPNNLTIDSISSQTECLLNPMIHRAILNRAVRLALNSKGISNNKAE